MPPLPPNAALLAYLSARQEPCPYTGSYEVQSNFLYSNLVNSPPGLQGYNDSANIYTYLPMRVRRQLEDQWQLGTMFRLPPGTWTPLWAFNINQVAQPPNDERNYWGLYLVNTQVYNGNISYDTTTYEMRQLGALTAVSLVPYAI